MILIGALVFVGVIAGAFGAGVMVGYHKARFSYAWGENYNRMFAGPRDGFMQGMMRDIDGRDFIDAHGVFGQIIKVEEHSLVLSGRDGLERIVTITPDTAIRLFRDSVPLANIHVNDTVVVVGTPDIDGHIQAQLIRLMPTPTPTR